MTPDEDRVNTVLSHWPILATNNPVEALGNAGGFSGSRLWRVQTEMNTYCLRRWPRPHPSRNQLAWIHDTLHQVAAAGCSFVPAPLASRENTTWIERDGFLWELAPWMPGAADFHQHPTPERLRAALTSLARWHIAASRPAADRSGCSPGLQRRLEQIESLNDDVLLRSQQAIDNRWGRSTEERCREILQAVPRLTESVRPQVRQATQVVLHLQPCIRDVWHDHILFLGDSVSGIVDYGAMAVDTVVGDIARLLGSLAGNHAADWEIGVNAYHHVRPLEARERELICTFDHCNNLLSGLNWIRWLYLEKRQFENRSGVFRRVSAIADRLRPRL